MQRTIRRLFILSFSVYLERSSEEMKESDRSSLLSSASAQGKISISRLIIRSSSLVEFCSEEVEVCVADFYNERDVRVFLCRLVNGQT